MANFPSTRSFLALWMRPLRFSIVSWEKSSFINIRLVHNFHVLCLDKTSCLSLKFRNLTIISSSFIWSSVYHYFSTTVCTFNFNILFELYLIFNDFCNLFSVCDHDSFSSSTAPSILRLFLRLRLSKLFNLSLLSIKPGITGCCCWWRCFWFCSNSLFRLSRALKFSSH